MDKLIQLFENAYLDNDNLSDSTRYLVNELFGKYGLLILDGDDKNLKKELEKFSITDAVDTKSLLLILIRLHISGDSMSATYWMDRLVQRFEVTKKLYQKYLPGFRKGEGSRDEIVIYWLFAVALSLRAHGSKRLKYLNTLLKVCDLLCSLPLSDVLKVIPKIGLAAVIAAEMTCTQILIDKGKINIE